MSKTWYAKAGMEAKGPFLEADLAEKLKSGEMWPGVKLWTAGQEGWKTPAELPEFQAWAGVAQAKPAPSATAARVVAPEDEEPPSYSTSRGFFQAIAVCFRKSFQWRGRASRSEYWFFRLFVALAYGLGAAIVHFGIVIAGLGYLLIHPAFLIAALAVNLALLLPQVAVTIRRLHDIGRTGWWEAPNLVNGLIYGLASATYAGGSVQYYVGFATGRMYPWGGQALALGFGAVLLAYVITMFVFMVSRGDPGPNRYG